MALLITIFQAGGLWVISISLATRGNWSMLEKQKILILGEFVESINILGNKVLWVSCVYDSTRNTTEAKLYYREKIFLTQEFEGEDADERVCYTFLQTLLANGLSKLDKQTS